MFRFGGSTRNFIFSGPEEDAEKESEFTVTELRENKLKKVLEATQKKEEKEDQGIDWGMGIINRKHSFFSVIYIFYIR